MYQKKLRILVFLTVLVLFCGSGYHQQVLAKSSAVKGIDVSEYNGEVDWEKVATQDISFAMIRTGLGKLTTTYEDDLDSYFETNYSGAGEAGINRGVYHVCCTRTVDGAKAEAAYCLQILNGRDLEYPVAYDMEQAGTFADGKENATAIALAFCEIISDAGYTPMLYTSSKYLSEGFNLEELGDLKIWVAQYGVEEPSYDGLVDLWQYSDSISVEGANTDTGYCDVNYSFMEAESVSLNKTKATLGVGEKLSLTASVLPEDSTDTVTWYTTDSSIATVSKSGVVKAKATGTVEIIAESSSGEDSTCTITVKKEPTKITVDKTKLTLKKGKTYTISPTVAAKAACNTYTYTSSNKSVATVTKKGVIKAKKAGTVTITVTAYNGVTRNIKVTVKA